MANFIIQEDMELFSSHGAIKVKDLYESYIEANGKLDPSFVIAGTYRGREYRTQIKYMEEIYSNDSIEVLVSGKRLTSEKLIVYKNQEFYTSENKIVKIEDITNSRTKIISLNGMLLVNSISKLNDTKRFLYIETELHSMPSLYATNMLLLPMKEAEKDLPFFIE